MFLRNHRELAEHGSRLAPLPEERDAAPARPRAALPQDPAGRGEPGSHSSRSRRRRSCCFATLAAILTQPLSLLPPGRRPRLRRLRAGSSSFRKAGRPASLAGRAQLLLRALVPPARPLSSPAQTSQTQRVAIEPSGRAPAPGALLPATGRGGGGLPFPDRAGTAERGVGARVWEPEGSRRPTPESPRPQPPLTPRLPRGAAQRGRGVRACPSRRHSRPLVPGGREVQARPRPCCGELYPPLPAARAAPFQKPPLSTPHG